MATTELHHTLSPATAQGLQAWVTKHAKQLVSLRVAYPSNLGHTLPSLPWALLCRLQSLTLSNVWLPQVGRPTDSSQLGGLPLLPSRLRGGGVKQLQLGQRATPTTAVLLLPQLKQLQVECCKLQSPDCLVQLCSGSTGLSSLQVSGVVLGANSHFASSSANQTVNAGILSVLQRQQQQLKVLKLSLSDSPLGPAGSSENAYYLTPLWAISAACKASRDAIDSMLTCIAAMPQLQSLCLRLDFGHYCSAITLSHFPASLRRLEVLDNRDPILLSPADIANRP